MIEEITESDHPHVLNKVSMNEIAEILYSDSSDETPDPLKLTGDYDF